MLGHPHSTIIQDVLKQCNINCGNKIASDFCFSCCIAKPHKLLASPSQNVYSKSLELIFMGVWGPSPTRSRYGSL